MAKGMCSFAITSSTCASLTPRTSSSRGTAALMQALGASFFDQCTKALSDGQGACALARVDTNGASDETLTGANTHTGGQDAARIALRGVRAAAGRGGPPDWELLTIQQNPQFWGSIQVWRGGGPAPNPVQ